MNDLAGKLVALDKAATQGEWIVNPFIAQIDCEHFDEDGMPLPVCRMLWPTEYRGERETHSNADLVAALVNAYRAKQLVVADGGEGVAWRDEDAEPQWQSSLPTSDAPTLVDEPIHADQITAPGRYMAPVDALGDPEILECIAISMDRQGMPLAAAKIREAAALSARGVS